MMGRHPGRVVLALLFVLLLPLGAAAQPLATADLADTWRVTYLAVPTGPFTASALHTYKGDVTFDASGVASGTLITDEFSAGALTFTVTGSLALSAQGVATGTLTLTGTDARSLVVEEARILVNRHTIVGAVTLHRPGATDTGLVTLLRLTDQTFSRINDLAATWNYHEITPSKRSRLVTPAGSRARSTSTKTGVPWPRCSSPTAPSGPSQIRTTPPASAEATSKGTGSSSRPTPTSTPRWRRVTGSCPSAT
jgi:hypothetical protein